MTTSRSAPRGYSMIEMLLAFVLLGVLTAVSYPAVRAVLRTNADNAAQAELAKLHNDVAALAAAEGVYASRYHRDHVVAVSPGGLVAAPVGSRGDLAVIDGLVEQSTGHGWVSFGTAPADVRAAMSMRTVQGRCAYLVSERGEIVSRYVVEDDPCRADRARLGNGDGALAGTSDPTWPGE